jgi:hypothetical protein
MGKKKVSASFPLSLLLSSLSPFCSPPSPPSFSSFSTRVAMVSSPSHTRASTECAMRSSGRVKVYEYSQLHMVLAHVHGKENKTSEYLLPSFSLSIFLLLFSLSLPSFSFSLRTRARTECAIKSSGRVKVYECSQLTHLHGKEKKRKSEYHSFPSLPSPSVLFLSPSLFLSSRCDGVQPFAHEDENVR